MKSARKLFPFWSVVCVFTRSLSTHTRAYSARIGRYTALGRSFCVCTTNIVRCLIVSRFHFNMVRTCLLSALVPFQLTLQSIQRTFATHSFLRICYRFVLSARLPELYHASHTASASYHKRKFMPTYSLVYLQDVQLEIGVVSARLRFLYFVCCSFFFFINSFFFSCVLLSVRFMHEPTLRHRFGHRCCRVCCCCHHRSFLVHRFAGSKGKQQACEYTLCALMLLCVHVCDKREGTI